MSERHPPDPNGQCWHGVARPPEESVLYDEVYQRAHE